MPRASAKTIVTPVIELPEFAREAQLSGATVLAHWAGLPGWHPAVWKSPGADFTVHWCLNGRPTFGPDPDSFLPMPSEPTAAQDVKPLRRTRSKTADHRATRAAEDAAWWNAMLPEGWTVYGFNFRDSASAFTPSYEFSNSRRTVNLDGQLMCHMRGLDWEKERRPHDY